VRKTWVLVKKVKKRRHFKGATLTVDAEGEGLVVKTA